MKNYKWGIAGTGGIAHEFAENFTGKQSTLAAVSSRKKETAEEFAAKYQIENSYATYEDMLASDIDIVYIAVPNVAHYTYIEKALIAGKHVLCEKAITMNLAELDSVMKIATEKNLVLQEAMTIFNMPLYDELTRLIDQNKLGKLKMIQAPFGSYKEPDPTNRFFNPDLAGGALLDIGTYAVSFARYFLSSTPEIIATTMVPFETGVDEQSVTILRTKENELATVSLSFQAKMPKIGIVAFENGYLEISDYPRADKATLTYTDGSKETIISGTSANAFGYEIDNFVATIEGKPNRSLFLTHAVIGILDQMQKEWAQ
ncbi:dehydrogenase [Enterococcus saigonensis]|uniref:Dehydrogenase n=1 Tax=Enterococcus saigonensis TaxID=1805431 RepID=A0A679I8T3_9ENTE|nr:Gfo/Idh/MocA family oxidoreductase [Enterococcus saigonensis]BCA86008.1 dehydrogenase [Enterococcus saigonensis]